MITIGKYNTLTIDHAAMQGLYLTDGKTEILLPKRYVTHDMLEGNEIRVFVYNDSEDRPIATTDVPYAQVDEFAFLEVIAVTEIGAFFDWGLPKDLFMPHSQKLGRVEIGQKYMVRVVFDDRSDRIIATVRLRPFFKKEFTTIKQGERVSCMVYDYREEGIMVILNDLYSAMIHKDEFKSLPAQGETFIGYIKEFLDDGKIRASLTPATKEARNDIQDDILDLLTEADGFLPFNDKSSPEDIQRIFGMSKKMFKKSVGNLYRKHLIKLEDGGIRRI